MSDTTETTQTTPAPEGEPQGKGGMMSFDAAASIADAFAKLKDGDAAPDAPIETEPTGPTNHSGEKGPEGEAGKPESEEKEIKVPTSDDLAKLPGVGPQIVKKLNEAGVYHYWQLAAMTADEASKLDADLKLNGRVGRDNWVEQARTLIAG